MKAQKLSESVIGGLLALGVLVLLVISAAAAEYTITEINLGSLVGRARMNSKGQVAFEYLAGGVMDIMLYDNGVTKQLTFDGTNAEPEINYKGEIVWHGNWEAPDPSDPSKTIVVSGIKKYSNGTIINTYEAYGSPKINNNSDIVYEVGTSSGRKIARNGSVISGDNCLYPDINDNGDIVWINWSKIPSQIFLNGTQVTHQVTDSFDLSLQINNRSQILSTCWEDLDGYHGNWHGWLSNIGDIYAYRAFNYLGNGNPRMNNFGEVVYSQEIMDAQGNWLGAQVILYRHGKYDVIIPMGSEYTVMDINDKGQILVWADRNRLPSHGGYLLLTPVKPRAVTHAIIPLLLQ
jgi:uncharacterized protein with NRDE domain